MNEYEASVARTLSRDNWYKFWRLIRSHSEITRDDAFTAKVIMLDAIRKYEVDGKVRLCDRFMDCDCAIGTNSRVLPANYYIVVRRMDEIHNGAEGPGNCWLTWPDNPPFSDNRDLALEAHENGHPHSIRY